MRRLNYYLVFFEDSVVATKSPTITNNSKPWLKIEVIYNADCDNIYTAYGKYSFKKVKASPLIHRMIRERQSKMGWEMKRLAYKD